MDLVVYAEVHGSRMVPGGLQSSAWTHGTAFGEGSGTPASAAGGTVHSRTKKPSGAVRSGSITASRVKRPPPGNCTPTVTRYARALEEMRNSDGMPVVTGASNVAEAAATSVVVAAAADRT